MPSEPGFPSDESPHAGVTFRQADWGTVEGDVASGRHSQLPLWAHI